MRVLIVEDEAAIAEEVAAYAAREGYETLWAADGEAAMSLWERSFLPDGCGARPRDRRARHRARHRQGDGGGPWRDYRGRQPAGRGQLLHGDAAAGVRKASITID